MPCGHAPSPDHVRCASSGAWRPSADADYSATSLTFHCYEMADLQNQAPGLRGVHAFHRVPDAAQAEAAQRELLLVVEANPAPDLRDLQRLPFRLCVVGLLLRHINDPPRPSFRRRLC